MIILMLFLVHFPFAVLYAQVFHVTPRAVT